MIFQQILKLDNALTPYLETHTPSATEGFYIYHHPNFVACSIGDITNSSNHFFMCDSAVSKTIFNKPVDVLGDVYTNGDLIIVSGKKVEVIPTTKLIEFDVLLFLIIKSFVSTYISALSIISFDVLPN